MFWLSQLLLVFWLSLLRFIFSAFPTFFLLIGIVGRRNLKDLFYNQIVVLKKILFAVLV